MSDRRLSILKSIVAVTACVLTACTGDSHGKEITDQWQPVAESAPQSPAADDAARFLAGMPGRPESPFKHLEQQPAWQQHKAELDEAWQKVEREWIPPMQAFAESELHGAELRKSVIFYPFSGPDALVLSILFPVNSTYVMVGLEPAGSVPERRRFKQQQLDRALTGVRESVDSVLHRSFFITREMDREFRGQVSDGLVEPILHLLVRTRHTILGYRPVYIGDDGNLHTLQKEMAKHSRPRNSGIQLDVLSASDNRVHQFFYFSVNLSDKRLTDNVPFLSFVSKLHGMTTLLKATSYMPHHQDFRTVCNAILEHSSAVLQDDSGIPFRDFHRDTWDVRLFGSYDRPYGSFRWLEQPDLRKAYQDSSATPLAFRIGYGFSQVPSNLQLAMKRRHTGK